MKHNIPECGGTKIEIFLSIGEPRFKSYCCDLNHGLGKDIHFRLLQFTQFFFPFKSTTNFLIVMASYKLFILHCQRKTVKRRTLNINEKKTTEY